ncbi:MAG: four helix bundle protein [Planctomycetota bacterium]
MAREAFETLPLWKAAVRLATDAHRVAAGFPSDEKSGLGGTFKKLADAPATLAVHADAAATPDEALRQLSKCEPSFRELLATALLAYRLDILQRAELRRFRLHVARLRRMVAEEVEAWEAVADEQQREQQAELEKAEAKQNRCDHDFDPRDTQAIERELDFDDVDAIGLTPDPPSLKFNGVAQRRPRKRGPAWTRWFGLRNAA